MRPSLPPPPPVISSKSLPLLPERRFLENLIRIRVEKQLKLAGEASLGSGFRHSSCSEPMKFVRGRFLWDKTDFPEPPESFKRHFKVILAPKDVQKRSKDCLRNRKLENLAPRGFFQERRFASGFLVAIKFFFSFPRREPRVKCRTCLTWNRFRNPPLRRIRQGRSIYDSSSSSEGFHFVKLDNSANSQSFC